MTEFGITFDCSDAPRLARFWAGALGYVEAPPPPGWASWEQFLTDHRVPAEEWSDGAVIRPPDGEGPSISFLKVPESKLVKNRVHLDLKVSGGRHLPPEVRQERIRARAAALLAEGATVLREECVDGRLDHLVLADPEGNEFCIV
ncbi:MAG: VOC family protein [Propionicimonas sp.]